MKTKEKEQKKFGESNLKKWEWVQFKNKTKKNNKEVGGEYNLERRKNKKEPQKVGLTPTWRRRKKQQKSWGWVQSKNKTKKGQQKNWGWVSGESNDEQNNC